MRRSQIYFILILLIIIIVLFGFQYLVSIYEVDIKVSTYVLYADNSSECVIQTVPLNSLGMKIPFRKTSAEIEVKEGRELIDITELNIDEGFIRIKALGKTGTVIIFIKPEKALLPSSVEIRIESNTVQE